MQFKDLFKKKEVKKDFMPINPTIRNLGGLKADYSLFGKSNYLDWYFTIPQLRGIIDYKVSSSLNGRLTFKRDDKIIDSNILDVLKNPNPFMGELEFWETVFKQLEIFQGCYVYKLYPTGFQATEDNLKGLFVLPFENVKPVYKNNINLLNVDNLNNYIDYYQITINGKVLKVSVSDIWFIQTSSLILDHGGILKPNNRLDSLRMSLANIKMANNAKNVILKQNGFLGFFSNGSGTNNDFGQVSSFDSEEQEKFQKWLDNFGFNPMDNQFALTNLALKYNRVDFDISSLKINEGLDYELKTIADVFKFDLLLLNQTKGSTFSNKEQAEKAFYQNSIIPGTRLLSSSLKNEFNLEYEVYFDFSHLSLFQEDLLEKSKFNETQINIILAINTQIARGELTKEIASSMLTNILEISPELANTLILENGTNKTETNN